MTLRERLSTLGAPFPRGGGVLDRMAALLRRPLDRAVLRRQGRLAELPRLQGEAPVDTERATRVLVLSLRGWPNHCAYEAVIAHALRLRGAEVAIVTCGGGQPACEMGWGRRAFPRPCDRCAWYTDRLIPALGLPAYRLVDGFEWGADGRRAPERAGAGQVDPEWAIEISLPWFLKTANTEDRPEGGEARRDYRIAAGVVEKQAQRILNDFGPDVVFMVNGVFASERVFRELAQRRGARVPTYEMAPRADTLFFSQGAPACDYNTDAVWQQVGNRPLTAQQQAAVEALLAKRGQGEGAHERYFEATEKDLDVMRRELDIEPGHRVVSLFTNISWDSAALGHDVGFPTMMDWITSAVRAAGALDDAVLVVRVHPGEVKWGTNEDVEASVLERLRSRPANVRIVPSSRPLDSYGLLELSDMVLAYTTTVGLEAATRGIPVAVAGDVHYRGRGFTRDLEGPEDLERALRDRTAAMTPEQVELAHRYAYTFFFRAQIPFHIVPVAGSDVGRIPASDELRPGSDPYLDLVCERILDGGEFILPDAFAAHA